MKMRNNFLGIPLCTRILPSVGIHRRRLVRRWRGVLNMPMPWVGFSSPAFSSVVALILHPGSNGLSTILVRHELFPLPRAHKGEGIGGDLLVGVYHLLPQVNGEMVPRLLGDVLFEALESSQYRLQP